MITVEHRHEDKPAWLMSAATADRYLKKEREHLRLKGNSAARSGFTSKQYPDSQGRR